MNEEADFKVALTTSSYTVITDGGDNTTEIDLMIEDVPACVCELKADFPIRVSLKYKIRLKQTLLSYLKVLEINSDLRSIFIGLDPEDDLTSLVEHHSFESTPRTDNFFKRWDEAHILMFQYTIRREQDDCVIVCMRTIYKNDQWQGTIFIKKPTLTVVSKDEFESNI